MCGVACGKTDYTATLKVFRVRVLSVANKIKLQAIAEQGHSQVWPQYSDNELYDTTTVED